MTSQAVARQFAIVIPTWNGWEELDRCLRSLPPAVLGDVIVVDNGSQDGTCDALADQFPDVYVVRLPENTGFAFAVNRGIEAAGRRDVVLLNNDTQVTAGWHDALMAAVSRLPTDVGFLQSKMLRAHDRLLDTTGDMQTWAGLPVQRGHAERDQGQWDSATTIFSACGGASWYRREMLDDVGVLAESFFAYYEDVDLCSRAQLRGWTGRFVESAVVLHSVSASSNRVQGFKRFQSTRNSWWLLVRTIPKEALPRVIPRFMIMNVLLLGQALLRRELGAALRGHLAALRGLPRVMRERRLIQDSATVPATVFTSTFLQMGLRRTLRQAVGMGVWSALRVPPATWGDPNTRARHDADAALRRYPLRRLFEGVEHVLELEAVPAPLELGSPMIGEPVTNGSVVRATAWALPLPFPDAAFDAAVSIDVLANLDPSDRQALVREMRRVTRPGGRVIVTCPIGALARWASAFVDRSAPPDDTGGCVRAVLSHREMRAMIGDARVRTYRSGWLPLWVLLQRERQSSRDRESVERLLGELASVLRCVPSYRRIYEFRV